ncbi:hypothetical protein [Curtobacterium poinsettiae]|uniref:DUF222 domain-containing protein n=1 Tax=Curtobacterium poinsettiae TaxID=159612 RepID=A0ABT3S5L4_9MICO|nr:hypothetical protein [Curtobacterium flaccumfaciens]MBT1610660.1 hypothetical protein [Curtobacterium flaccumfaciens pv. poinsettiae]MCX2850123.1 hypothetical protein [Curtobacterium flaccumfaciens pv. poinsettiae]UXN18313.1 hypothetical protein N8D78_15990 [Curtobacterium flaccumfaciens pv. poinsettiae]
MSTKALRSGPETDKFADLVGCWADLRLATELLNGARDVNPEAENASTIASGLGEAAVMSYARCFSKGRRAHLTERVVPEDARPVHRIVLALRDKYTGHSVNAMSQAVVTGQADNWPDPASIRGLAFRALIQRSLVIDMFLLVATVRDSLADEIEAARHKVLLAHADLSTAGLLRLGDVRVVSAPAPGFDFVGARRSGQSSGEIRIPLVGDPATGSEPVATLTIV